MVMAMARPLMTTSAEWARTRNRMTAAVSNSRVARMLDAETWPDVQAPNTDSAT